MSSFKCELCNVDCIDTEIGYITGCEHHQPDYTPQQLYTKFQSLLGIYKILHENFCKLSDKYDEICEKKKCEGVCTMRNDSKR